MATTSSKRKHETPKTIEARKLIPKKLALLGQSKLKDDDYPAGAAYELANKIIGQTDSSYPNYGLDTWEPESIWITLTRQGIDISELNRQKILCISALKKNDVVFDYDPAFQNVVLVLNNEFPDVEDDEPVEVNEIVWAMTVLSLYLKAYSYFMDYGPYDFCARVLHEEGFFVTPGPLDMVQDRLDQLNNNHEVYKTKIISAIQETGTDPAEHDDIIKVAVERHNRSREYSALMLKDLQESLAEISDDLTIGQSTGS